MTCTRRFARSLMGVAVWPCLLAVAGCGGQSAAATDALSSEQVGTTRPARQAAGATPDRFPVYFGKFTSAGGYEQRWGYIDRTGRVAIPARFRYANRFDDSGLAEVHDDEGAATIDRDGEVVFRVPDGRAVVGAFSEGLAWFVDGAEFGHHKIDGGRWGCINTRGEVVIAPKFGGDYDHQPGPFCQGLARVRFGDKWGFVDVRGQTVVAPAYDDAGDFSEGLALVATEPGGARKYGFIDRTGRLVVPRRYDDAAAFHEGLAAVRVDPLGDENGQSGFIDRTGRVVLEADPARYEGVGLRDAMGFREGLAAVHAYPKEPLPPDAKCPACERAVGGMLPGATCPACEVPLGERGLGFVDRTGRFVIPPTLWEGARIGPFNEGLCALNDTGKWGYIDRTGRVAILPRFDEAGEFSGGLAEVWMEVGDNSAAYGYVDRTGRLVWEPARP